MFIKRFSMVAISLLTTVSFVACGDDSDDIIAESTPETTEKEINYVQPFLRVAELDGNWSSVPAIADIIAEYIHVNDEAESLKFPTDWIVAGAEESGLEKSILGIPFNVAESNTTEKIKMVELCNKKYASLAMDTGSFHASALPCQVSIHSKNNKIYVDILDPNAIFSLFFYDLPEESKIALKKVAEDVKNEIVQMVQKSLEKEGKIFVAKDDGLGPKYDENDFETLHNKKPFIVFDYKGEIGHEFTLEELELISKEIINHLGHEDNPANIEGLSAGAGWISAREEPIPIPQSKVIEACSPKYAKMATGLGTQYATALPCEIAVTRKNDDNSTLQISYTNPTYMFDVLFNDALISLSAEDKKNFAEIPNMVYQDLKLIVDTSLQYLRDGGMTIQEAVPYIDSEIPSPPNH